MVVSSGESPLLFLARKKRDGKYGMRIDISDFSRIAKWRSVFPLLSVSWIYAEGESDRKSLNKSG